jgi:hypothetical protein
MHSGQHYRAMSDLLHLLKRALSSVEEPPMVVGLDQDSPELSLGNHVGLLGDDPRVLSLAMTRSPKCMTRCQRFLFVLKSW